MVSGLIRFERKEYVYKSVSQWTCEVKDGGLKQEHIKEF